MQPTATLTVALYARVSTKDQDCAIQIAELRQYAAARGWTVAGEYVDTGFSGAKASRPDLDRLMSDARHARFSAVLVYKLDRFGRSLMNCVAGIQALTTAGVRFLATSQGIDTDQSNPTSRLMLHILAAVAEFEREMINERTAAGRLAAQAAGVKFGRKPVIFDRQVARDMAAAGSSVRDIAAALGISVGTAHRTLTAGK